MRHQPQGVLLWADYLLHHRYSLFLCAHQPVDGLRGSIRVGYDLVDYLLGRHLKRIDLCARRTGLSAGAPIGPAVRRAAALRVLWPRVVVKVAAAAIRRRFVIPFLAAIGVARICAVLHEASLGPVGLDLAPLDQLVLLGHNVFTLHPDLQALAQAAFLAEASSDHSDVAVLVEGAGELLLGQRVPSEERLAALAGDRIEVVAQRLVPAHRAVLRRRHFDGGSFQLGPSDWFFNCPSPGGAVEQLLAVEEALGGWLVLMEVVVCGEAGTPRIRTTVRATA